MELGVTGKEPCREATLGGRAGVKEKVRCGGGPDNGQESSVRGEEMGSRSLVRCVCVAAQGERGRGRWDRAMLVSGGASRETREMGIGPGRGLG